MADDECQLAVVKVFDDESRCCGTEDDVDDEDSEDSVEDAEDVILGTGNELGDATSDDGLDRDMADREAQGEWSGWWW